MWSSLKHDAEKGPWSTHVRAQKMAQGAKLDDFGRESSERSSPDPELAQTRSRAGTLEQQTMRPKWSGSLQGPAVDVYEGT